MKRSILLIIILTIGFIFSVSVGQVSAKTIEMSWATGLPPFHGAVKHVAIPWTKMIEERTKGSVKINVFPGGALVKDDQGYPSVVSGIVDIAPGVQSHYPGRFPLSGVLELPLLGFSNANSASKAFWELYQKFPEIQAEYSDVHVLWLKVKPLFHVQTIKKPVHKLEDLKGLKLRCGGGMTSRIASRLGVVPVVMPAPDTYLSMERGIVGGSIFPWEAMSSFKLYELVKYHTEAFLATGPDFVVMNKDLYNGLPKDIKKVFDELSGEWGMNFESKVWDEQDAIGKQTSLKAGNKLYKLPPDELKRWKAAIRPIWDEWIADMEKKGLPGRKVFEEVMRLRDKYAE